MGNVIDGLITPPYTPRLKAHYRRRSSPPSRRSSSTKTTCRLRVGRSLLNIGCGAESVRESKKGQVGLRGPDQPSPAQQAVATMRQEVYRGVSVSAGA